MSVRDHESAEPVTLSSTLPTDQHPKVRLARRGFDLLASRARLGQSTAPDAGAQGVRETNFVLFAEIYQRERRPRRLV